MIRSVEQESSRNALEVWGSILLQQNEIDDARALYEVLLTKSKMLDTGLFRDAIWQKELLSPDPELIKSKDRLSLKLVEYYLSKQKEEDAREILPNIIQAPLQHQAMTQILQYWEKLKLLSPEKLGWMINLAIPAYDENYPLLDIDFEKIVKGTITIGSSTKDFDRIVIFKEVQPFLIRLEESKERSRKNDSYQFILFLIEKLGSWPEYRTELQELVAKVYPSNGFPDKSHKRLFEPLMNSFAFPDYLQVLSEIDNESWKRDAIPYLAQSDPGIKTLEQARSLVYLLSNPKQQQEAWENIVINWAKNQSEEQCLVAIQQLPNTALMAHAYLEMLRAWGEIGQAEKAKSYLKQALSLIDSVNTVPSAYYAPTYESLEEARKAVRQQAYVLLLLLEDSEEAEKIRITYAFDIPYQEILRHMLRMLQTEKYEELWQVCQQFPGLFNNSSAFDAFHADLLLLFSDFQQNTLYEKYLSLLPEKLETSPFEESNSYYQEAKTHILKSDHEQALLALNKIQDIHWKSKALAEYYLHFQENSSALTEDFKKTLHLILVVLIRKNREIKERNANSKKTMSSMTWLKFSLTIYIIALAALQKGIGYEETKLDMDQCWDRGPDQLLIIGIIDIHLALASPSYATIFQVNAQYFPFFIAHLTPLWVLIHALYLLSVSSRFLYHRIKPLLFWSLVLLCLQIPFWPIFGLVKYYYHFGQQSSWFRLFNVHNQMYLSTYWLSAYLIPLLLMLFVFLFIAYRSLGKKGDAPNKTIPLWLLALSSSLALLLLWGMALSYRDADRVSQAQALGGIKNQFHWIAIYNPFQHWSPG